MTVMNAEERERFLATLRKDEDFRAEVRRELLTEELLDLPRNMAALVDAVAQQRQDFTALSGNMAALVDAVAQQRQDFTALAQSVANYMERTISAIGEGFAVVRAEVGAVHTELGTMRVQMDAGFTSVQAKFDQVDADLQNIRDQLAS